MQHENSSVLYADKTIFFILNWYIFLKYMHYKSNYMNSHAQGPAYYVTHKVFLKKQQKTSELPRYQKKKQALLELNFF